MSNPLLTRTLGRFVSTFLLGYFCVAWYVCCYEIGYDIIWKAQGRKLYAGGYIVLTTLIVASIVRTFIYLLLLPSSHCSPLAEPLPRSITHRSIPLACSPAQPLGPVSSEESLELDRCHKGLCKGGWKTGRTRHCSVCKRCRVGFDHHCPWFNNCLTLPHMKAFLLLTSLTPVGILIIAIPATTLVLQDLRTVLAWSYKSELMREIWWGRWYAWVPGPIGRWAVGIVWSYKRFAHQYVPGMKVGREPSLFYLALLGMAVVFSAVCLALTVSTTLMLSKGELSVDRARRKSYKKMLSAHPTPDQAQRDKMEAMKPMVKLFMPDLQGQVTNDEGVHAGSVVLAPATWRADKEDGSLLQEVWRGPLFPNSSECGRWDEEKVGRTVKMQGYL
ncbi:DHHC palmitoyltransferase-domain-containing protein [Filobasidium floriforme]|uniref:DHHC palmitoyltransferase-domain-containing protein n=1 Tax=Filobasidium floriforme TaxID=5210 RepID=UPI001E8CD0A7|nr:DHHC palmitoyltransferase-domain-containing protein [Filobasidium floriforme]KAH8090682.1 DHHC palmitoyltransferase-domain-containing protein [Filobasidium floriforme]